MTNVSEWSTSQCLTMTNDSTQPFVDLIASTLGMRVREQDLNALAHKLLKRVQVLGLPSLATYYQHLVTSCESVMQDVEWRELIDVLTVNESYFFRDQGQFALLRKVVLPELIQSKQQVNLEQERTIRVRSAGCSTGEEAYSLAILLKELIPADQPWNIVVLGTDINEFALAQARRGLYSDWSFRSVNPEIRQKYFRSHSGGWEVIPEIRRMVTFHLGNLVQDDEFNPHSRIHDFDLILCRNVFIYFNAAAIATVLDRFYQALTPTGYLMTGHTELHGQNLCQFQIKTFSASVLYQRQPLYAQLVNSQMTLPARTPVAVLSLPISPLPSTTKPSSVIAPLSTKHGRDLPKTHPDLVHHAGNQGHQAVHQAVKEQIQPVEIALSDVTGMLHSKAYPQTITAAKQLISQRISQLISQTPDCFHAYCLMAEAYANSGDHANAITACQTAMMLSPFAIEPIYLLTQISQEQGDFEGAKSLLRQVIYLAPTSVYAYFELGCLYEQEGNINKARRHWRSALDSLKQMAPSVTVDYQNRLTAAELQAMLEQNLNQRPSPDRIEQRHYE